MNIRKKYHLPTEDSFRGKISVLTLSKMWKSKYGVSVDRFFASGELELIPVQPYNYYRFSSAKSGDAEFYGKLMRHMGYDCAEKPEFSEAILAIDPRDKVLDVGCGIGNFSLRCPGLYRGIDTNPTAVEDAAKLGRNVQYGMVQDEEPNSYDVVTAFQVLEHVDDPNTFLRACISCLRPGGILIISTPNMGGVVGYTTNEILNYPPHHMTWWSHSSLQSLISDCDCELTSLWLEPLQPIQFRIALLALLWPRNEKHLTTSRFFPVFELAIKVLARIAGKLWGEIPFIAEQTVMVVARKK